MTCRTVKFYNGNEYPSLGLGTWKSKPNEVTRAVQDAIDLGYRHLDCAAVYENEKEVGAAIASKIKEGVVKREDIFITSKLWNTRHRPEVVESALKKTLSDLGLQYLDLYLIHWPSAFKEVDVLFPQENGKLLPGDTDYLDTWRAMEALLEKGLVKNIGVSNFNKEQLERLLANCKVKPMTNQVECHPHLSQAKLSEFCASKGITITAYSPFASPDRPSAKPGEPQVLTDPKIIELATKYKRTPAQIILRSQIQRGHLVIPKSVTKSRIAENSQIFDFELSAADMQEIMDLDRKRRVCPFEMAAHLKYYPFRAEY